MKVISGKRMCQILEEKGWGLARATGSRHIDIRPGTNLRITVPIHGNQDLKIGLQRAIMKLAGVTEEDL
jgi:predicted RNA binding protein YcfA (HicA-like mRNA interferase family)